MTAPKLTRRIMDIDFIERFFKSAASRLQARRGLIFVVASVILLFVMFSNLELLDGLIGFAVFFFAAAFMPRRGILRPTPKLPRQLTSPDDIFESQKSFVNVMVEPALLLNHAGLVLHGNKQAEDFFSGEKQGQHISTLVRNPDVLDAVSRASTHLESLTVHYTDRVPVERYIAASIAALSPQKNASRPRRPVILLILRDLTQQERLNQMRSDFIANASHELRTPLASLLGFIETLQGPARDDDKARDRFLAIMARQAQRMTRLIDDLLSLSRAEMNAHLRPSDRVDVNNAVGYVIATLEPLAEENKVNVDVDFLSDQAFVLADRDELTQVFQNLIQNAIKYAGEGNAVQITVKRSLMKKTKYVSVSVKDNGPGIAAEHLPRLTERFYRVDVASSREKGGTGLGLAIVKHVVNRHRGSLEIKAEIGQGSEFIVNFPEVVAPGQS